MNSRNMLGHPAQMQTAQAFAAPPSRGEPSNASEGVLFALTDLVQKASLGHDRILRAVSRAYGEPMGDTGGAPKPVPAGTIGAINEQLSMLDVILTEMEKAISRIDTII